jgi:predicted signal transduction protein with EAL and GGDEF domain
MAGGDPRLEATLEVLGGYAFVAKPCGDAFAELGAALATDDDLLASEIAGPCETADQEAFLRAEKCDEVQGYFYSRPMPAGLFTTLLSSRGSRTPAILAG